MKSPYLEAIQFAADTHGLDPLLVRAVVIQESAGRADAFRYEPGFWLRYLAHSERWQQEEPRRVSSSYGLMQILYPTAVDYGYRGAPEGLFDISTNLDLGCRVLKSHLVRFGGQIALALAAYNAGPGNTRAGVPYAQAVLKRYQDLQAHG